MAKYHEYVFDVENRRFIGDFEAMYKDESVSVFDSWHQEDTRQLNRKIAFSILDKYNFKNIVDVGCGKGTLTYILKKNNNYVVGLDVSPTAAQIAKSRYPDIDFDVLDINDVDLYSLYLKRLALQGGVDLVAVFECLSYLSNWREFLSVTSSYSEYIVLSLFLPEDPIGAVKDIDDLEVELRKKWCIIESVELKISRFIVIFAKSNAV
jgi:SAM-dependent methyltransferase